MSSQVYEDSASFPSVYRSGHLRSAGMCHKDIIADPWHFSTDDPSTARPREFRLEPKSGRIAF